MSHISEYSTPSEEVDGQLLDQLDHEAVMNEAVQLIRDERAASQEAKDQRMFYIIQ